MGHIYQSKVETNSDLRAETIFRQDSCVIHEILICHQSQHTIDHTLISDEREMYLSPMYYTGWVLGMLILKMENG